MALGKVKVSLRARNKGFDLGYLPADIFDCVKVLTEDNFRHCHKPPFDQYEADVYYMDCDLFEEIDPLYIKLGILDGIVMVLSFERQGGI